MCLIEPDYFRSLSLGLEQSVSHKRPGLVGESEACLRGEQQEWKTGVCVGSGGGGCLFFFLFFF